MAIACHEHYFSQRYKLQSNQAQTTESEDSSPAVWGDRLCFWRTNEQVW